MKKITFLCHIFVFLSLNTKAQNYVSSCPDDNHPHAIDLGLPSGTLWSCCNVGADKPESPGGYYAWGEVSEKSDYSWDTYQFGYKDNNGEWIGEDLGNISGSGYDVAHVIMGGGWHMPSENQFEELCKKCYTTYVKIGGVGRILITGPSSNSIVMPLCGVKIGSSLESWNQPGTYWSNTADPESAVIFVANYSEMYTSGGFRYVGNPIRAVMDGTPNNKTSKDIIKENGFKPFVNPLLKTSWSQSGAENSKLPYVDPEQTERAATGCGATAMAQILKYWEFPINGIGDNYYAWKGDYNPNTIVLSADFYNSNYDWDQMIQQYSGNNNVTQRQTDAIANLMYDIAVALEMKLSFSTATQIEYIHTALKKYFGYNPNMQLFRQTNYSTEEWITMVYKELSEGRPILMGGRCRGINHIFVADGYDEDGLVHLNLGHSNSDEDIYYDLTEMGRTYSENMRMIIGICPQELPTPITSINVSAPGKLLDDLGGMRNAQRVTRIKVSGAIDDTDIALLSKLTQTTTGQLSYIDLSDCSIKNDILPPNAFCTGNEYNYTLQQIFLPQGLKEIGNQAFFRCRGLYEISLPKSLERIGNYAFGDCRYLTELTIPGKVSIIGANPFIYNKMDNLTVENNNSYYVMNNNALMSKDGSSFISLPLKPQGDYTIPEGVQFVNNSSISEGFRLRSIHFPTTIQTINSNAFVGYTTLENMYFYGVNAPEAPTSSNILQCVIHVPHGCKEEYANNGWDKFAAIVDDCEADLTSVEGVSDINKTEDTGYYSLQGVKIEHLTKGIYIKNGKKVVVK